MKKEILLMIILFAAGLTVKAQYAGLSDNELQKLKTLVANDTNASAVFGPLRAIADKALTEQPNPIEKITTEGKLAGDPDKIKTIKAVEDARKIYAMAIVYKLYNDNAYLDKDSEYLLAWARTNKSTGDPIDETRLEDLIAGYDIVRKDVKADVKKAVDSWLQDIWEGELNSKYMASGRGTAINNWNSHRIKILTMIAYTLHNDKFAKVAQNELTKQVAINLYADGNGYDFTERDALHYHIYTLEPLITAATVIYRGSGIDYFNYQSVTGSSIKKSVDFLVPFVTGEKTHGEFLNSHVAFDKARAKNGEKDYQAGALFKTATGIHVLEQAAYFSNKYMDAVQSAVTANGLKNNEWETVLNKVREPFVIK
jgi:hypothetical protein